MLYSLFMCLGFGNIYLRQIAMEWNGIKLILFPNVTQHQHNKWENECLRPNQPPNQKRTKNRYTKYKLDGIRNDFQ